MKPSDDKPQGPAATLEEIAEALDRALGDSDITHIESDEEMRELHPVQWACSEINKMLQAPRSSVATNEADIYADGFAAGLEAAAVEVSGHWNVTGLRCDQKEQAERSAAVIRRLPIARSSRSAIGAITAERAAELTSRCAEVEYDWRTKRHTAKLWSEGDWHIGDGETVLAAVTNAHMKAADGRE